jgi:Protein of unknown function (DUF4245)
MTKPLTARERQRLRNPANLWRALIPLLAIVAVIAFLMRPSGVHSDGVHVIDVRGPIASAREQAGFPIQVPVNLPETWRPTSSQFIPAGSSSGASFDIGYVSPTGKFAEFLESNDNPEAVSALYGPLVAGSQVGVEGVAWDNFQRSDGRQLLLRTAGAVTVIVTGSAPESELVQLAGSLH